MSYVLENLKSITGIWFDIKSWCLVVVDNDQAFGVRLNELRLSQFKTELFFDYLISLGESF